MEHASSLRGYTIIAYEEGKQLGSITAVNIDLATKRIASFSFRDKLIGGEYFFVLIDEVKIVGENVVIITSKNNVQKITDEVKATGTSLKKLQGAKVATNTGKDVGTLLDFDFSHETWRISDITFAEDKHLAVDPDQIQIADVVIIPAEYEANIIEVEQAKAKPGYLEKISGSDFFNEIKGAINKVLPKSKDSTPDSKEPPQENVSEEKEKAE